MIAINNIEHFQIFQRSVKLFNKSSSRSTVTGADAEEDREFDELAFLGALCFPWQVCDELCQA